MRTSERGVVRVKGTPFIYLRCRVCRAKRARDRYRSDLIERERQKARKGAAVLVQPVWARVSEIPIDGDLIRSAGDLAERYALRGYDAIHLAALLQRAGLRTSRLPAGTAIAAPARRLGYKLVPH
jgi:predicted nucleic acid-binding protein